MESSTAEFEAERLRSLVEQLPAGAVYTDGDRLIVNAEAERITGQPRSRVATMDDWFALLYRERAAEMRARYEAARARGYNGRRAVVEITHASGEPRYVEFSASSWEHGDIWVLNDVTERHRDELARRAAEAALREADEHFRSAFEEAPIGMAITTDEGRYLKVNPALCAITGYTAEQLLGLTLNDLTHPDDREATRERLRAARGGTQGWRSDKRYMHADGRTLWVSVSATPVRTGASQPMGLLTMVQDITERRTFEEELRRLAEHDPLTGLLNRRRFAAELERQVAQVRRYEASGALLVLDLDSFKRVNDTHGHEAGDELLVAVADVLRARLRETDVIARLGGDEFAVILPHTDGEAARAVAAALVEAVRASGVTVSIGVSSFDEADTFHRADLAMYEAKGAGGDRWAAAGGA